MMDYGNVTTRAIFWQFCTFIDQGKTQRRGEQPEKIEILLLNNKEWINSVHDSNSSWDQDGTQIILFCLWLYLLL